jgi:ketosteroid isomerase-like protein
VRYARPVAVSAIACLLLLQSGLGQGAESAGGAASQQVWFGAFTNTLADGKVSHDVTALVLKRDGTTVSGSVGPTIDRQSPFSGGSLRGDALTFHIDAAGGIDFALHLGEGHLRGTAKGSRINATLDLAPAPGLMPHSQLMAEITAADARSFAAFENCDADQYRATLDPDLEFYQDNQPFKNQQQIIDSLNNRCAEGIKLRRELDQSSRIINATPPDYAIESGLHRFYSKQADGSEHLDATARFTLVWSKKSGTWRIIRAISYDHR